jgi:hypothetical protein
MQNAKTPSAHTPGPWVLEPVDLIIYDGDGPAPQEVAVVSYDTDGGRKAEECEANARLIVAAPELLNSCARTQNILRLVREGHLRIEVLDEEIEILQRVIFKANSKAA